MFVFFFLSYFYLFFNFKEETERDDFQIKPNDNLLLVGHIEEDSISLEVKGLLCF